MNKLIIIIIIIIIIIFIIIIIIIITIITAIIIIISKFILMLFLQTVHNLKDILPTHPDQSSFALDKNTTARMKFSCHHQCQTYRPTLICKRCGDIINKLILCRLTWKFYYAFYSVQWICLVLWFSCSRESWSPCLTGRNR